MIEISSGLPRKSSAIFDNLRKSSEIFATFGQIMENFRKSLESGRKFGKLSIMPSLVCLYNKKNITR